ncbi:hypothetical protein [Marinobacterium stanieri]|uniref:hypothetical protein n=1 Tax=Marinobacterium stanieri TaxID=49186 RepID=UPI003A8F2EDF
MKLCYFFDPGSGICLWANDDEARENFGYSIDLESLPLSQDLVAAGTELIEWFDTSIDWDYPPNLSPWSPVERAKFKAASSRFFARLGAELGPRYELVDRQNA